MRLARRSSFQVRTTHNIESRKNSLNSKKPLNIESKKGAFKMTRKQLYKKYENTNLKNTLIDINGEVFELPSYYKVHKQIGFGAYGTVVSAIDTRHTDPSRSQVAIKKMTNVFEHKIFARRILRELRILRLLKHENIIELIEIILPKSRDSFNEIYVVFQLMDFDMKTVLKSELVLTEEYCQFYLYQILRALKFIHSAKIVHRDLKPRNILIDDNNDLKICDFGMSRFTDRILKNVVLTDYVTTRWYRAPQLLMGCENYSTAIDIWSTGCIFVEMLTKEPFLKANDTKSQLQLTMKTLGIEDSANSQDKINETGRRKTIEKKNGLDKIIKDIKPEGKDLIKKMLAFKPKDRISAQQALRHPYLRELHLEEDEPECDPLSLLQFEFQDKQLSMQQLKDILYQQILLYHFKDFCASYEAKKKENKSLIEHIINGTMIEISRL